ncbi:MAG: ATPase, T2SS/T4P/T4SS family [Polyangiales bacterium]
MAGLRSGLVLVTGPTRLGQEHHPRRDHQRDERGAARMHFVTIEDPIEFVHANKMSLMSQREVGPTRGASRRPCAPPCANPDAILVGEMRDLETISMALAAAETGVLVFGTLHTNSAAKTLDRIINVFPADKQPGVRGTLAAVTRCVVARLCGERAAGARRRGGGHVRQPRARVDVREGKTPGSRGSSSSVAKRA